MCVQHVCVCVIGKPDMNKTLEPFPLSVNTLCVSQDEGEVRLTHTEQMHFLHRYLQLTQHVIGLLCVQADDSHLLPPISGLPMTLCCDKTGKEGERWVTKYFNIIHYCFASKQC